MDTNKKSNYSFRTIFFVIILLLVLIFSVVFLSYAVFQMSQEGSTVNTLTSGTLVMNYVEGNTGISITDAIPMSDEAGKKLSKDNEQFKFVVSAEIKGDAKITYEVVAVKKNNNSMSDDDVRLYLEKSINNENNYQEVFAPAKFTPSDRISSLGAPAGSMLLESGVFHQSQANNYILRMWASESMPVDGVSRTYTVTINVYGEGE